MTEPTQPADYSRYESTQTSIPPIPPPPPSPNTRRPWWHIGVPVLMVVALVALILVPNVALSKQPTLTSHLHLGVTVTTHTLATASVPTPTQTPTLAPIPAVTAMQVYLAFEHHGLTNNDGSEHDSEYQQEGINPPGGIVDFTDQGGPDPVTGAPTTIGYAISVFKTSSQAVQAATILFNGGDNTYLADGFCMLHIGFAVHASAFVTQQDTAIMDTMCKS